MDGELTNITDTDNLEDVQSAEPVNADNSGDVQSAEPVNNDVVNTDNEENSNDSLILGKFKTQDDLINAYSALEKHQGEKAKELAELRAKAEIADNLQKQMQETAENYGFKNVEELQTFQQQKKADKEYANFLADEYAKHLNAVEFPEEMRNLLLQYKQNPDNELLETIKSEFPLDVIEQVAVQTHSYKGQLEQLKYQALEQQEVANATQYLKDTIVKYDDDRYFRNNEFKSIYKELFKAFGTNLDTDYTIKTLESYVQSRIALNDKLKNMKKENSELTDTFENVTSDNLNSVSSKGVLDMSEAELSKALRTTFKHL